MDKAANNIKEKLEGLRKSYSSQLPEKIAQIEDLWSAVPQGEWDAGHLRDLGHDLASKAHTIAGSAASFGFANVSSIARVLEKDFKAILEAGTGPDETLKAAINSSISALKKACLIPDREGIPAPDAPAYVTHGDTPSTVQDKKVIFLVDDDTDLLRNLSLQISHFGYDVRSFTGPSEMQKELENTTPLVIIMDIAFPEGELAGVEMAAEVQKGRDIHLPVIFISTHDDFNTRLRAARVGGEAYFEKPVTISSLIDKLDVLTTKIIIPPYRILIVDDDAELAAHFSLLLQHAGMITEVVTDPLLVMSHLSSFNPDLILMDMYMPECNGLELAKVIRQIDAYLSIPIVFLSAETNIDKQMTAMSMGGDDFLTKPIQSEHLISSVTIRAERMRIIRSLMDRDSLTGLLNHTKTKDQLDIAVERTRRQGGTLSFAMIDIDKFKAVNDTYGHPTGDRVIISLSRLLQQRLRKTDIVGRYGGEEFAVVLVDTDLESAMKVLDGIRDSFSQIRHLSDNKEFSTTFSCGIASFPKYNDATDLNNAADRALYAAKHQGRNRVVPA